MTATPKVLPFSIALMLFGPAAATAADPIDDDDLAPRSEATDAGLGYHPWMVVPKGPGEIDVRQILEQGGRVAEPVDQPDFWSLDEHMTDEDAQPVDADPALAGRLPDGWVQQGSVVLPEDVALGIEQVDTDPIFAVEDYPGNKYPRKHTLFLNFNGGMLYSGRDNSAENKSTLAKQAVYPTYTGGETKALSIIQAVQADVAPYGIRIMYQNRPSKTVPYTMAMVGGSWTDTNIDSPAGGVAPGADCGALGQRHVVYAFASGGSGAIGAANTISQEAGHAWGLDHIFNCNSVMSYCTTGDANFQSSCAGLCEGQCQGDAGCRLTHEMFCGVGNDQQNDDAELTWIFGGNEPDMEAPTVEIVEPEDGLELEAGGQVRLRALVDDNYGGFGWKIIMVKDGETVVDEVDYFKDNLDDQYRVAFNLSGLMPGTYEITIEAEDQADHVASDSIMVFVGEGAGTGSGDSASSTGDGGTSGGATDDGGSDGSSTTVDQTDPGEKGCGCQTSTTTDATAWMSLMLLGVAGIRRRRRM